MYMKQLSTISFQLSAKNRINWLLNSVHCSLRTAHSSQKGVGAAVVVMVAALILIGVIAVATPQIRNVILPSSHPAASPSPSAAASQYSEKQQLYLRNKEAIKQGLNLTEEQFNLLVQNADKN
jgi:hypothetical protein